MKTFCLMLVGLVVALYTTFVLQNLWNWFATTAFHVPAISFWPMYGLTLLISAISDGAKNTFADEQRWKNFAMALDACIPDAQRQNVQDALQEQQRNTFWETGVKILAEVAGYTLTLVIGWAVHSFLM